MPGLIFFQLDGMPNNAVLRSLHKIRLLSARAFYHLATFDRVNLKRPNSNALSERIIIKFVQFTGFGRNNDEKWLWKIDSLLKKYPYNESNWL